MSQHNLHDLSMFTAAVKYGRTAEFGADERSSITNRSTTGGVQSGATDQKGRGAMSDPDVVEHAHTTHPADAKCAASTTAETHQPGEFVTLTVDDFDYLLDLAWFSIHGAPRLVHDARIAFLDEMTELRPSC